jgi:ribonuclease P/MRP protein subunit RPP1
VDGSDDEKRQRATARAALEARTRAVRESEGRDGAGTLARCTIAFGEPGELRRAMLALGEDLEKFDVLALEPTSERAFASACANKHADVVSVGAGRRLRYKFTASAVRAATGNRISFELCYGEALRDSNSRMWFFANASALARATRGGRELFILSSGAERAIELRSMYDVVNLATFFGMTEKAARAAMTTNVTRCWRCVNVGETPRRRTASSNAWTRPLSRRSSFFGRVRLVDVARLLYYYRSLLKRSDALER